MAESRESLLQWFPAPKGNNTGAAVIIFPGGGYYELCDTYEGREIAEWFNGIGMTAVICRYRLGKDGYHYPAQLEDAQSAIRTVRAEAESREIKPNRIGVIGFSAGGHLASLAMTHFDTTSRPDFGVLAYPVIMMGSRFTHRGTQINLLGFEHRDSRELCAYLSTDKSVTPETPPCFIYHTAEDTSVPCEHALKFYTALRNNDVQAELHIFAEEPHGSGLAKDRPGNQTWPELLRTWLMRMGFIGVRK